MKIIGESLDDWINKLDRLSREPTIKTKQELNTALESIHGQVEINTHVISGRLKSSIQKDSNSITRKGVNRWEGEVRIGEGVPYAKYEIGDRRTGSRPDWIVHPSHDPLQGLEAYDPVIDAIVDDLGGIL